MGQGGKRWGAKGKRAKGWRANVAEPCHYNNTNGPWLEGPDLNEARWGHTAGLIFDKVNHTQYTVVVGGWNGSHYLRSVEILKEGSNEWTQGKSSNSLCHCVCLFLIYNFFF